MPCTTFLDSNEVGQSTGDEIIDFLLPQVRKATGENYQVVMHTNIERYGLFYRKRRPITRPQLYVEVPGVGPWEVLMCASSLETVRAYLYGALDGANAKRAGGEEKQQ